MKTFYFLLFLISLTPAIKAQHISEKEKLQFASATQNILSNSSTNYDVNFYRCSWEVDPAVQFISGSVTTYFTITAATNNIVFDLNKALTVDSVLYHGAKISFTHNNNHSLQVNFPSTISINTKDSVSIFYKGAPTTASGSFTTTQHNGVPVLWTLSEPYGAREWWPCKDMLTDKADSIDIIITYPSQYRSSTNGLPVNEVVTGSKRTEYWQHRYPIVSYLVAIAITNYVVDNDAVQLPSKTMPVVMYSYPESGTSFKAATNVAKASLQKFSEFVGEYPFVKERYAQTQFSWGGGMEHQTNSFIVSPNAKLVAHELAHQWFGDKVTTASWQHLWLNEGFATYFEYLYVQYIEGSNTLSHLQGLRNNIVSNPGGSVFIADTNNINRLFDSRLTYNKGAYLVHMLRWKLGDTLFFKGLKQYLNDPALSYRSARIEDLQRNLQNISGQNLTEFFDDWLYGQGYPNYSATWSPQSNGGVQVKLSQTTSHSSVEFFEMPVPLLFRNATRDTIITINHTLNNQVFNLNPEFLPDTMIIDPQLWILAKDKSTLKVTSLNAPVFEKLTVFPNPVVLNNLRVFIPKIQEQVITLRLINSLGQAVFKKSLSTSDYFQQDIFTKGLPSGIYWIEVWGDRNFYEVKKVMIVNN